MIMRRDVEKELDLWKYQEDRKPLCVFGPRRVGKTTTILHWAKINFDRVIALDFENNPEIKTCFHHLTASHIAQKIEQLLDCNLKDPSLILICDGMDQFFRGMIGLKLLQEVYPNLPIIISGKYRHFGFDPSYFTTFDSRYMSPMTFKEFLRYSPQSPYLDLIKNSNFDLGVPEKVHQDLLRCVEDYLSVGGLPSVVLNHFHKRQAMGVSLSSEHDQENVYSDYMKASHTISDQHHAYMELLQTTLKKKVRASKNRCVQRVLKQCHSYIGVPIKYNMLDSEQIPSRVQDAIRELSNSFIIHCVNGSTAMDSNLSKYSKSTKMKLYYSDLSLLNAFFSDAIFEKNDKSITQQQRRQQKEQFVIQELHSYWSRFHSEDLYYWFRDRKSSQAQLDVLWVNDDAIIPIDVLHNPKQHLPALSLFIKENLGDIGITISDAPLKLNKNKINVPFYLISELPRILTLVKKNSDRIVVKSDTLTCELT